MRARRPRRGRHAALHGARHLAAHVADVGGARQRRRRPRARLRRHELRAPRSPERAAARRRPGRRRGRDGRRRRASSLALPHRLRGERRRSGCALNPDHYTRGWHATATIGTLGCAAAAARMLGLDVGQTRHALGIAASLASGLKENFGSMTKPFHAGHAARNGVFAAHARARGPDRLRRRRSTAGRATPRRSAATKLAADAFDGLGRHWQIAALRHRGEALPVVRAHPFGDRRAHRAARAPRARRPRTWRTSRSACTHVVPDVLRHARPTQRARAQVLDAVLRGGRARPPGASTSASSRTGRCADAGTRELMEPRAHGGRSRACPTGSSSTRGAASPCGSATAARSASPPRGASGHPDQPLTDAQLRDKFLGCAAPRARRGRGGGASPTRSRTSKTVPDIRALTARLVGPRRK